MIDRYRTAFLEGANVFSDRSVIRVDLPPLAPVPGAKGLVDTLRGVECVHAYPPAAAVDALLTAEESPALVVLLALGIEFQRASGAGVCKCATLGQNRDGTDMGWFDVLDLDLGIAALRAAAALVAGCLDGQDPAALRATATEQLDLVLEAMWREDGPNRRMVERCADRGGIHWRPMLPGARWGLLGIGARSLRYEKSHFETENILSNRIQTDKMRTSFLLSQSGISVPKQALVYSEAEAVRAAEEIGYPLITKPRRGSRAKGITMKILTEDLLRQGYHHAVVGDEGVIVERYFIGTSHRFFVMSGELMDVIERGSIRVTGDGKTSIRGFLERMLAEPERGEGWRYKHYRFDIGLLERDARAPFREMGYTFDSVPRAGETVPVSHYSGGLHGGLSLTGTTDFHPGYRAVARRTVEAMNMPLCAIDMISSDITAPPTPETYVVNEVNAWPGFHPYLRRGPDDRLFDRLFSTLIGPAEDLRVPVIVVLTEPGIPSLAAALAQALGSSGRCLACASRDGYWIDGHRVSENDHATLAGSHRALDDKQAEAIIAERFVEDAFRTGLGLREIDAAIYIPPPEPKRSRHWKRAGYLRAAARRGAILLHSGGTPAVAPVDVMISAKRPPEPNALRSTAKELLVADGAAARLIETAGGNETPLDLPAIPGLGRAGGLTALALNRLLGDALAPRDAPRPNQADARHWQRPVG